MQVGPNRVRIPNNAVLTERYPPEVLVDPPLLIVEVLSPDDSYAEIQSEVADYFRMEVPAVWIVEPKTRTARQSTGHEWTEVKLLTGPGSPVQVNKDAILLEWMVSKRPPAA